MKIAIDVSPLKTGHYLQHTVRGSGVYLENLKSALEKFFPENTYIYFTQGEKIKEAVDIVHIPYFEPFFLTLPRERKRNAKYVVTVHDLTPLVFPKLFPPGIKGNLKWRLQKHNLLKMDAVITDSASSKQDISSIVGMNEDKISVVHLAAGEEFRKIQTKKDMTRIKYKLPDTFALYVGDVTANKNLPRLIKAVKRNNISLVMVGKSLAMKKFDKKNIWNRDLSIVQDLANNDKNIYMLGFVPLEDLVALYNTATVFCMPSLYEGFGLPVLEAMSCGCPVIATDKGSLKEVAGDAAFFVDANSEEDIANGIRLVMKDTNLQKILSVNGLLQAQKFSWKKTASKTLEAFKSLIS